jgi:hypothetical protein
LQASPFAKDCQGREVGKMKRLKRWYPVIGNYWLGGKAEAFAFGISLIIGLTIGGIVYYYRGY